MLTPASGPERIWSYAALFLVALVTLTLELLFTRLISVMAYYYLSFFIISIAILGMTVGALAVYLRPDFLAPGPWLGRLANAFFVSVPAAVVLVLAVPITSSACLTSAGTLFLVAVATGTPFFLSGVLISVSLTRCGLPYGKAYAADLAGAACGCFLSVPAANVLQPGSIALGLSALAALAAYCYQRSGQAGERSPKLLPYFGWLVVVAVLIGVTERTDAGLRLVSAKGKAVDPAFTQFQGWNSQSFVMVSKWELSPGFAWGNGRNKSNAVVEQASLYIDAGARTEFTKFDGDPQSVRWLFNDVTMLACQLQKPNRTAVIGVGGGRDALAALAAGADHVAGIDVNSIVIDLQEGRRLPQLTELTRLKGRSDLTFVHDDARSYLTQSPERFDLITMSLVDTWAASSAGAYALSENGLYTLEAWGTFFDRLSDRGLFTVSRWYSADGGDEATRTLSMAIAVCLRKGLKPREHIAIATVGEIATLIISRSPIEGDLRAKLASVCKERDFGIVVAPGAEPVVPLHRELLNCATEAELAAVCDRQPLIIAPATDDQPYFFNQLRPASVFVPHPEFVGPWEGNLKATNALLGSLMVAILGVAAGIFWPLSRFGLPKGLPRPAFRAAALYFAAIGLGFMLVEIALVQRFSVLLGHPSYSLACVIGSMVLATGVGSLVSGSLPVAQPRLFFIYPLVVLAVQLLAWLLLPLVFAAAINQGLAVRVAATLAFTIPCGLVMGVCFPLGMVQLSHYGDEAAPWMWGVNGAAGVVGTALAVVLSMNLGISATFLAGSLCYAALLPANWVLTRPAVGKA